MKLRRTGSVLVALAAVSWSFAGVLSKSLPWHSVTRNGMRSLFAALLLMGVRRTPRVRLTKGTLLGALGVSLTSLLYMLATQLTTAANAIVLQYAMPVFVIALCWAFYGQRPRRSDVVVAGFILLGVLLCSWQGLAGGSLLGDMFALLSAVTFALVFFCARMPGANPRDYTYLGMVFGALCALYAFFDPNMTLAPAHWLIALAMGVCLAAGYALMSLAMDTVSPFSAAILSNIEPILSPVWVFLFLGEAPGALTLVGAGIVLVTATLYSLRGKRG